ncbi:DMT family transporter [Sphingobium ummariense]|uniref:EamA domain-containing protein n=1 Tax=Sphingobium ummariense RL-3 TaxID=1346791 RepID=T0J3I1_9SPHN|nr:DMT family transporter [Sphingobium ummariense]EQB32501.1 hypothetical protein M529_09650 [Sphingobium ummariense RL-3]
MAIGLRLLTMLFLSTMFMLGKVMAGRGVTLVETLFYRQLLALPLVMLWVGLTDGLGSLRTRRIGKHASRTAMGLTGMMLNFGSYILLPLTEATTIGFSMPIFATLLSALLLREATGPHRWAAILIGFVGILIMARPDATHFSPLGVGVAVAAAVMTACISLLLRDLGRTENAGVIVFWFTALSMPPLAILMLFFGKAHDLFTWGLLILLGLTGGAAQLCMTGALRWAPVSIVLPMDYSAILWATIFGFLIWNEWPLASTWAGAALIIASGLYIAWREHVRARRARISRSVPLPG